MVDARVNELKDAYKKLQSLDRLKDEFLATISHEFKTPLSAIIGHSELTSDLNLTLEKSKNFGEIILSESIRLLSLVENLLDHTSLVSGRLRLQAEPQVLDSLIEESLATLSFKMKEKMLEIIRKPSEIKFVGDGLRVIQVIVNLLSNAIKFAPEESVISVNTLPDETGFTMTVIDQGAGIPKKLESVIFETFCQHRSQGSEIKGTGLRLSISKQIVLAHGGKIWAEANDKGGRVSFYLSFQPTEQV